MVKHIIIWKLKEGLDQAAVKQGIKTNLESLNGRIEGLLSLTVQTEGLDSSTGDLLLDCTFKDAEALKAYAGHPLHQQVANTYVRPYTAARFAFDYVEE